MLAILTTISAQAADMGVPPPARPAPEYIPAAFYWTGFYIGGEAGGGWGNAPWNDAIAPGAIATVSPNGFLVGGFIGINYQMGPAVLGIEGTFDGNWFNGNTTDSNLNNLKTQVFWTATTVARLGIAFDRLLVYGKGGAAFAYDRATETTPVFVQGVGSLDRVGWTVGGGVEYAFTEHFTGRVEYDYLSFSTKVVPLFGSGGLPFATDIIGLTISEAKAGVAYKF